MIDLDRLSIEEIRQRLKAQPAPTYDVPPELLATNSREAAVLIPFLRIEEAWHILFIRRSTLQGDRHSGQVAFAGGKRETFDHNLESTALRETEEEIGIAQQDVEILGSFIEKTFMISMPFNCSFKALQNSGLSLPCN